MPPRTMIADLLKVREAGDTAGGAIEIVARGVPAGAGRAGFRQAQGHHRPRAVQHRRDDGPGVRRRLRCRRSRWAASGTTSRSWTRTARCGSSTNNCGGFLGGMSNGEDLVMRLYVKPTPTISKPQDTVDMTTMEQKKLAAITRRDISICPRIYPVAEAMVAIAILDALFMARGWYGVAKLDPKWENLTAPRYTGDYTI